MRQLIRCQNLGGLNVGSPRAASARGMGGAQGGCAASEIEGCFPRGAEQCGDGASRRPCSFFLQGEGEIGVRQPEQDPVLAGARAAPSRPPASRLGAASPGGPQLAEQLACKGVTVLQLLQFCSVQQKRNRFFAQMLTQDIVRDIVLPETAQSKCCYMKSNFMCHRGGGSRATTLVSHAWGAPFQNTVVNILLDASGWPTHELLTVCFEGFDGSGIRMLNAALLLRSLSKEACQRSYWLCIFAVNQHTSICEGYSPCICRAGVHWTPKQPAAEPCPVCNAAKRFPCRCGSRKARPGDAGYELDVLPDLAPRMGGLMMSLDPGLAALSRLWVQREVSEAHRGVPLSFRAAMGLDPAAVARMQAGTLQLPEAEACETTTPEDRRRILAEIGAMPGGRVAFQEFVRCLVELTFGLCQGVKWASQAGAGGLARLSQVEIDLSWCGDGVADLAATGLGHECASRLPALRVLRVHLRGCSALRDVEALGCALGALPDLRELCLDLRGCCALSDLRPVGRGLAVMHALRELSLHFCECSSLCDLQPLTQNFSALRALTQLRIDLASCGRLLSVQPLANSLAELRELKGLSLALPGCDDVDRDGFAALTASLPQKLATLTLDFNSCGQVGEDTLTVLAKHLPRSLAELKVNLLQTQVRGTGIRLLANNLPVSLRRLAAFLPAEAYDAAVHLRESAMARGCKDCHVVSQGQGQNGFERPGPW